MKYVEIISYTGKFNEPPQKLGEVQLKDGQLVYVDLPEKLVEILKEGVMGDQGIIYKPQQKTKFLEALQWEFSGSAIRASEVKER